MWEVAGPPAVLARAWGRFAAPRSQHRLPLGPRVVFELAVFAVAVAAPAATGATAAAVVLAVAVLANAALLTALDQWEG